MSKFDGGAAFPRAGFHSETGPGHADCEAMDGMTLRDWFAGQALAGLQAGIWANNDIGGVSFAMRAQEAYKVADAMLAARGQP